MATRTKDSMVLGKVCTVSPTILIDSHHSDIPCARSGHAAVADDTHLYVFGGYNPDVETLKEHFDDGFDEISILSPLFKEMWKFNFDLQRWTLVENHGAVPDQLASMSMVRCGRMIVLYGGTGFPFGYTTTTKFFYFSIRDNRWRSMLGFDKHPIKTYGQAISYTGSQLYVFGGTTGWEYSSNVCKLDMRTGRWETCFDFEEQFTMLVKAQKDDKHLPLPRYRHEMLSDGNNLFVIGGGTSHLAYSLEMIHVFDTRTKEWKLETSKADPVHGYPGNRRCHSCAQLGNDGYITGGFDGHRIFSDIWKLSIDSLQWTKLEAKLPEPVYFHCSAITPDGCLYCHGGVLSKNGLTRTGKLNFVWVKLPSLLRLAWAAILNTAPKFCDESEETLRVLGIPEHLIRRIK